MNVTEDIPHTLKIVCVFWQEKRKRGLSGSIQELFFQQNWDIDKTALLHPSLTPDED